MSKKKKKNTGRAEAPVVAAEETETVSSDEQDTESTSDSTSDSASGEQSETSSSAEEHADDAHGHGGHDPLEDDRPNNLLILLVTVISVVVVIVFVVGVRELFNYWGGMMVHDRVLAVQSSQLRELRASEQQKLGHYQWANKQDGVVRIPTDRAVELTIAAYRAPVPPPPPQLQEPSPTPKPEDGKVEDKKDEKKDEKKKDEKKGDKKDGDVPKEPRK